MHPFSINLSHGTLYTQMCRHASVRQFLYGFHVPIFGSCFPPDFGGSCSGIPDICTSCDIVCAKHQPGMEVVIHHPPEGKLIEI